MMMVMMMRKWANALLLLLCAAATTTTATTANGGALTTIAAALGSQHQRGHRAAQQAGQSSAPVCEVCGCSFCPPGFVVNIPAAMIPLSPEVSAPSGMTEVPCSLLDYAGTTGQIPANLCNDELRLDPEFRTACGCPALPPAPTANATSSPQGGGGGGLDTVIGPLLSPAPACEVCGCSFCPPGFVMNNPAGVIPIPPQFLNDAPPGFSEVPCALLDMAGTSGQISADLCNDDLRLLPLFRTTCGCPALPPALTATPTVSARPTMSAMPSLRPSISAMPSTSALPSTLPTRSISSGRTSQELAGIGIVVFLGVIGACVIACVGWLVTSNLGTTATTTTTANGTTTPGRGGGTAQKTATHAVPSIYWQEKSNVDKTAQYVNTGT